MQAPEITSYCTFQEACKVPLCTHADDNHLRESKQKAEEKDGARALFDHRHRAWRIDTQTL